MTRVTRVFKECIGRAPICSNACRWTEWLNNHFPLQWVGRNGPVACPLCSPDLNLCDFCLWSWMKQLVMEITTVSRNYRRFSTSVRGGRYSFYVPVQKCCDVLNLVLPVKDNIFNIYCKKKTPSELKIDHHEALPKIGPSQDHHLFLQLIIFRIDLWRWMNTWVSES